MESAKRSDGCKKLSRHAVFNTTARKSACPAAGCTWCGERQQHLMVSSSYRVLIVRLCYQLCSFQGISGHDSLDHSDMQEKYNPELQHFLSWQKDEAVEMGCHVTEEGPLRSAAETFPLRIPRCHE